jgi:hypothetical protein
MRSIRRSLLSLTVVAAALAPCTARAQQTPQAPQPWQDSWYWGVYGGGATLRTNVGRVSAPTVGGEWFITRTDVALRVFAEQSTFTTSSQLTIEGMAAPRLVSIADLRRVGFSLAIFAPSTGNFKPYLDLGYAFNLIGTATDSVRSYASTAQRDSVNSAITKAKSSGKLFGGVGATMIMGKWAPFGQVTIMPTKGSGNSLINGDGMAYLISLGLRYNFGRSSEKIF